MKEEKGVSRPLWLRVVAWVGICLLIGMYVFTLIVAVTNKGDVTGLLMGCIGATIVVPVILWINLRLWQLSMERDRTEFKKVKEMESDEAVQGDEGQEGDEADTPK